MDPTKGVNTPTLDSMTLKALQDLNSGLLDAEGQAYAAQVLGEALRRLENGQAAARASLEAALSRG